MELADLPVSVEPGDPVDVLERDWTAGALESRTVELWRRARAELGQRYAIGLQGPGMSRPARSPADMGDNHKEE
jgi:hypothetical protein